MSKFIFWFNMTIMSVLGLYQFFTGQSVSSPNILIVCSTLFFMLDMLRDEIKGAQSDVACACGHQWLSHNDNGCCWDDECQCTRPAANANSV